MEATVRLDRLRSASGGFAMLALDQRESLREMFPPERSGELVDDDALRRFKSDAVRLLSDLATGVLLDYGLGLREPQRPESLGPATGLLLAADVLHSERGRGVRGSSLDPRVTEKVIRDSEADGIKYLVIWRRGDDSWRRDLEAFLTLGRRSGVASFVEGIVRPPDGEEWRDREDRHDAIIEAAAQLSVGADVYKAEVPGYSQGDLSRVEEQARRMTATVGGPWVVLSNGVQAADFAEAVRISCSGGGHGFLAGRAIWADTVDDPDTLAALADRSASRLIRLSAIVEETRSGAPSKGAAR